MLNTKTQGKISLVILLTGMAVLTKILANRDKEEVKRLHSALGQPDKIIEFQRGFDRWQIERYGEKTYLFRNGVLLKSEVKKGGKNTNRTHQHRGIPEEM